MPCVEVNGVVLHYVERGTGPVHVIFGHGLLGSSNIWRDLYFPYIPENWHAWAPDFRGHGGSAAVDHGCTFTQLADDVSAMARALGIGRYVYVGLSMGGGVGLQLALKHPDDLLGLGLVSPVTGLGPLGNRLAVHFGPMMAGKRWIAEKCLRMSSAHRLTPEQLAPVIDEAMLVGPATLAEFLAPENRLEGVETLSNLAVPSMIVIGDRDRIIPPAQQKRLAAILPDCTALVFPDEGHSAVAEKAEKIRPPLYSFVERAGRSRQCES